MASDLKDTQARQEAIDSKRSFIVQAPAGSGKTSLLVQRFLNLLCEVEQPEQILAITFTRKAAEEMRDRVISELLKAKRSPRPTEGDYEIKTWDLACAALQRDSEKGWNLLLAKERLRIKTIDSLCLYLANRLPVASHFGAPLAPSEDCDPLYREAVREALNAIDTSDEDTYSKARRAYENMLNFCGNDKAVLIDNLCVSLQNRALWLENSRKYLLPLSSDDPETVDRTEQELQRQLNQAAVITIAQIKSYNEQRLEKHKHDLPHIIAKNRRNHYDKYHQELVDLYNFFKEKALTNVTCYFLNYAYSKLSTAFASNSFTESDKTKYKALEKFKKAIDTTPGKWMDKPDLQDIDSFPDFFPDEPSLENTDFFLALRHLFIAPSTNEIRKKGGITISIGFPSVTSSEKKIKKLFLEILESEELTKELQNRFDAASSPIEPKEPKLIPVPEPDQEGLYRYREDQIKHLKSSAYLLEICYTFLREVFRRRGVCDYTEIALNAIEALGSYDNPSQLALQMDSEIKHILVDEYQDTSKAQLDLLAKLTSHWQKIGKDDDQEQKGRTIFMVGDPMQSIYRFRQADVGIYLRTRKNGLRDERGSLIIKPGEKLLETNFRSTDSLIAWYNKSFQQIFPQNNSISTSAITYSEAASKNQGASLDGALKDDPHHTYCIYEYKDKNTKYQDEARFIVDLVKSERESEKKDSSTDKHTIAILFQKGAPAQYVIDLLRRENIPYEASGLEKLSDADPIQDLIALTKSLLHLEDRVSWLALLRSPLVGLNDEEITRLAEPDKKRTLWEIICGFIDTEKQEDQTNSISPRLEHLRKIIQQALEMRGEQPLSRWIQGTWLALGGPLSLRRKEEGGLVREYFSFLESIEANGLPDAAELERTLAECSAVPNAYGPEVNPVKLMTMHKAKGLEFDTVILPFLECMTNKSENGLLRSAAVYPEGDSSGKCFDFFAVQVDKSKVIIDPETGEKESQEDNNDEQYDKDDERDKTDQQAADTSPNSVLYKFIKDQCDSNELKRLFYVASTRARKRLYLVAFSYVNSLSGKIYARPNTLLSILPALDEINGNSSGENNNSYFMDPKYLKKVNNNCITDPQSAPISSGADCITHLRMPGEQPLQPITRLADKAWNELELPEDLETPTAPVRIKTDSTVYGEAFHTIMELICAYGLTLDDLSSANERQRLIEEAMSQQKEIPHYGLTYDKACENLHRDLQIMLNSPQGRWAVEPHEQSNHEEVVCYLNEKGESKDRRLDRVFCDGDKFWIIDYKTGHDKGHKPNEYHEIMETYARLMELTKDHKEIHLALIYVNHKRTDHGGPIFLDCGLYKNGHTEWGEEFAPKL